MNIYHRPTGINKEAIGRFEPFMRIKDDRHIYFNGAASRMCGIKQGTVYMHFIEDDDFWLFYTNNEDDGFATISTYRESRGCEITCEALCKMMHKKGFDNERLRVEKTGAEYKGWPLFKLTKIVHVTPRQILPLPPKKRNMPRAM